MNIFRKSNFAPAFFFLPPERREALQALYAVCHAIDEKVDSHPSEAKPVLDAWRRVFLEKNPHYVEFLGTGGLARTFLDCCDKFQIPLFPMVDLIDKGGALDLSPTKYQTAMDTEGYCYGVAGTVGIACLPIFGVPVDEAKHFAIRLGIAIQWINLIRDIGEDTKIGRIYFPVDHLEQFGRTDADVFSARDSGAFMDFLKYETEVARAHYRRAMELMPLQWTKKLLPARVMGRIYLSLLEKIEKLQYPVFQKRVHLNLWDKGWATWKAVRESYGNHILEKPTGRSVSL